MLKYTCDGMRGSSRPSCTSRTWCSVLTITSSESISPLNFQGQTFQPDYSTNWTNTTQLRAPESVPRAGKEFIWLAGVVKSRNDSLVKVREGLLPRTNSRGARFGIISWIIKNLTNYLQVISRLAAGYVEQVYLLQTLETLYTGVIY